MGGGTKAGICPTTWTDSKWRPVPSKRDGCLIPNLIGTYLCEAKNGKKICYRTLDCSETGVEDLEVTILNINDSCVKILYMRKTVIIMFHPRTQKFRNVRCFEFK